MAKLVRAAKPKDAQEKVDSGKKIQKVVEFRFNVVMSYGDGHRAQSWEEAQQEARRVLLERWPDARFTPVGGYILIDGRACYPDDFDMEIMDRKPGTHPPLYTLTHVEQEEIRLQDRIARDAKNPNHLARNPVGLLTTKETDHLKRIRSRGAAPVQNVEWTAQDAENENLAEQETAKLLKKLPASRLKGKSPAKLRRKA